MKDLTQMPKLNPIKYLHWLFIFLLSTNATALTPGNSAWLYGKNESWIQTINAFNQKNKKSRQLNYLFPEIGSLHIDNENKKIILTYDPSITQFYKTQLPNIKIMPDISFWVANTNFKTWSPKEYQAAAKCIAGHINQDKNADGVFLDLESYKPSLLPFYVALVKELSTHHKLLSVIVRPGQENIAWFNALGKNAFVVLYGYDLHQPQDGRLPVSPIIYESRLSSAMNHLMQTAEITHTPIMGGVPVIATTYEWEQKMTQTGHYLHGQYRQIDYLKAALTVYRNNHSENYMGFSIWAFVLGSKIEAQRYLPNQISKENWGLL